MGTQGIEEDDDFLSAITTMAAELDRLFLDAKEPYLALDDEEFVFEGLFPFLLNILPLFGTMMDVKATSVLRKVGEHISAFSARAFDHIYSAPHLSSLIKVLVALSSAVPGAISQSVMTRGSARLQASRAGLAKPPALREYEAKYGREDRLNELLNRFTQRVQSVYGGANTIEAQLPTAGAAPALCERNYCDEPGGNEVMPLSPEFQAFVDLFVRYETHGGHRMAKGLMENDVRSLIRALNTSHRLFATFSAIDQERQLRLDRRILQLLRAMLYNEICLQTHREDRLQRRLARLGCVLAVANMLSSPDEVKVQEALSLLCMLLKDGNKAAQRVFMHFFLHTREESFFEDVKRSLLLSIRSRIERRALLVQVKAEREKTEAAMGTLTLAGQLGSTIRDELGEDVTSANDDVSVRASTPLVSTNGRQVAWEEGNQSMELMPVAKKRVSFTANAADTYRSGPNKARQSIGGASQGEGNEAETEMELRDEGNIELLLRLMEDLCEGEL